MLEAVEGDLVERLRECDPTQDPIEASDLMCAAANEIGDLRAALSRAEAERDEAVRERDGLRAPSRATE